MEFDLSGVDPGSMEHDVERNVLTVKAGRPRVNDTDSAHRGAPGRHVQSPTDPRREAGHRAPPAEPTSGGVLAPNPGQGEGQPRKITINAADDHRVINASEEHQVINA